MTTFCFIRHGQVDFTGANTGFYTGWGFNLLPLSPEGVEQIRCAAQDERLRGTELILSSPFTRAMQSAALLASVLGVPVLAERDLHEWLADTGCRWLIDEEADRRVQEARRAVGEKHRRERRCGRRRSRSTRV